MKDYKNNQIPTNPEIMYFPNYHIDIPDKELVHFLVEMKRFSEKTGVKHLTKSDCISVLNKIQPDLHLSKTEPKDHNRLNRSFLIKLERQNFIEIERKPRGKVTISEEGEFAISIFAGYFDLK
ncbi:MAG: hypothetical protein JW839_10710 [Candidatus Lokiarchaeota archaeon]|nr:hypothetical protein [Candidatus Lokiarchaeota archaeon]